MVSECPISLLRTRCSPARGVDDDVPENVSHSLSQGAPCQPLEQVRTQKGQLMEDIFKQLRRDDTHRAAHLSIYASCPIVLLPYLCGGRLLRPMIYSELPVKAMQSQ